MIASTVVHDIDHEGFSLSVKRDPDRQSVQRASFYPRRPSAGAFAVPDDIVDLKDWFPFEEGVREVPVCDRELT